jgi:glutathione S-transferase
VGQKHVPPGDAPETTPFTQVWLALEEKDIQYDSVMIDLYRKPSWYEEIVPTKKVPAVSINGDIVWESKDILLALEERFPDNRPLMPQDADLKAIGMEILEEMEKHDVGGTGFKFMAAGELSTCNCTPSLSL